MSLLVKNLSLKLANSQKTLVKNLSFSLEQGKILALVGESGSGKSLTALSILRLLPNAVKFSLEDDSEIRLSLNAKSNSDKNNSAKNNSSKNSYDLLNLTEVQMQKIRGREISMIFQEPLSALNPVLKVGKQIEEGLIAHTNLNLSDRRARVETLLLEVELQASDYNKYPHQLSGGQNQRILIAIALACQPKILIADEPTTALDANLQENILNLIKKIQKKHNLGILLITHDLSLVAKHCDEIMLMYKGEVIETALTADFFNKQKTVYAQQLLANSLPSKEYKIANESKAVFSLNKLNISFPNRKKYFWQKRTYFHAINDVNLDVFEAQTLAIVGESGSGKTTLGFALIKLLDYQGGSIKFNQEELQTLTAKKTFDFRCAVQIIFQDPFSAFNPRMTIFDIIAEPLKSFKIYVNKEDLKNRIIELVYLVRLVQKDAPLSEVLEILQRYPHQFSGGQRQRIAIARALATQPEIIICDEPTSALDVNIRSEILNLLNSLQETYKLTIIFITHDLSIISKIAHRVAVMQKGRIIEINTTEALMTNPQQAYTKLLLNSLATK